MVRWNVTVCNKESICAIGKEHLSSKRILLYDNTWYWMIQCNCTNPVYINTSMGVRICTYHGITIKVAELLQCSLSLTKLNQTKEWASKVSPTPCRLYDYDISQCIGPPPSRRYTRGLALACACIIITLYSSALTTVTILSLR